MGALVPPLPAFLLGVPVHTLQQPPPAPPELLGSFEYAALALMMLMLAWEVGGGVVRGLRRLPGGTLVVRGPEADADPPHIKIETAPRGLKVAPGDGRPKGHHLTLMRRKLRGREE